MRSLEFNHSWKKWLFLGGFLAPSLIIYMLFFLWPLSKLIRLSTYKWDGISEPVFVGLQNYQRLLTSDARFWGAFQNNLIWVFAALLIPTIIGLMLAILLVQSRLKGKIIFRTLYFLPQVLSSVVVAIIWRWIYNPTRGALNVFLNSLGLNFLTHSWLGEPGFALVALFISWSWIHYGFTMVIFIAALQSIDESYYDAAKVEGGNFFQILRYITLPFIRNPLATVLLITAIAAFQVFDLIFIMTKGGPGWSTLVLSVYMYNNAFQFSKVGYGSAVAVILGLVIFILTIGFLWLRDRFVLEI
jgi:raffinose/stachyose/melibiose transport system permease protein